MAVLTKTVHSFLEALGANSEVVPHLSRDVFLTHSYQFTSDLTPIGNSDRVTLPHRITSVFHCLSFQFCLVRSTLSLRCHYISIVLVWSLNHDRNSGNDIQIMKTVDADALV